MGRWGPTGLGPEEAALWGAAAVGDGGVVRLARVALCVAVGLSPRDPLLLAPPRVVIGGIADVVVDKGVGLLVVRVDLILAVASLGGQRIGGVSGPVGTGQHGLGWKAPSALVWIRSASSKPWTVGTLALSLPGGIMPRCAHLLLPSELITDRKCLHSVGTEPADTQCGSEDLTYYYSFLN